MLRRFRLIPITALYFLAPLSFSVAKAAAKYSDSAPSKGLLLVAERPRVAQGQGEAEGIIGIVDPETGKELARIPEGGIISHMVALIPGTNLAFVPIYGAGGVGNQGTDGTKISVIDLAERKVIDMID